MNLQIDAFKVIRADRAHAPCVVEQGATVYKLSGYDYGVAADDNRATGIEHISVTFDATGDYPFFTIPREDLEFIGQ